MLTVSMRKKLIAMAVTAVLILMFGAGGLRTNQWSESEPVDRYRIARLAKLEQQAADAKSSADNAWMLISAALVLMMTGPGLALFYGGLVRKKNVLGTMMQSFALMAVDHGAVGAVRLQPVVSDRATASSAACRISFCAAWELRPTPTTPPPFRRRPSWSIS